MKKYKKRNNKYRIQSIYVNKLGVYKGIMGIYIKKNNKIKLAMRILHKKIKGMQKIDSSSNSIRELLIIYKNNQVFQIIKK